MREEEHQEQLMKVKQRLAQRLDEQTVELSTLRQKMKQASSGMDLHHKLLLYTYTEMGLLG